MKVLIFCTLFCFLIPDAVCQGINLKQSFQSWDEVLTEARQQNKSIFVDFSTQWCIPCREMEMNVFSQKNVGDVFNKEMISVKVDAEKNWGKSFAKSYKISAYPTYIFFNQNGEAVLVNVGAVYADKFIELAKTAITNAKAGITLEVMQKKMKATPGDLPTLFEYVNKLSPLGKPNALLLESFLTALPADSLSASSTVSLVTMTYVSSMPTNTLAFKVLTDAYKRYPVKSKELMSPWSALRSKIVEGVDSAGRQGDLTRLRELINAYNTMEPNTFLARRESDYFACRYDFFAGNYNGFIKRLKDFALRYILKVDSKSLYKLDKSLYKAADSIKYLVKSRQPTYSDVSRKVFLKTFFTESERTYGELYDLAGLYTIYKNKHKSATYVPVEQWMEAARRLFNNSPLYTTLGEHRANDDM